ncbi:MAG: PstC family ABC transporter permease [bacterium]
MQTHNMVLTPQQLLRQRLLAMAGRGLLLLLTSVAAVAVLLIIGYIARDALPFFRERGFAEFFTSANWYPSREPAEFGALSIIVGSVLVTVGAAVLAVPLGVAAAVCLSDVMPFGQRQVVKPVVEILAAIPSVAYGFFALVVLAPLLQTHGGALIAGGWWVVAGPLLVLGAIISAGIVTGRIASPTRQHAWQVAVTVALLGVAFAILLAGHRSFIRLHVASGVNALNASLILGIMALPTVVSVSEDALQAVGRELREGSYALGATRAETLLRVVLPAASSGIFAASLLGIMRALGETMVVWMASGNAAQIPSPWYNLLEPVRTLTATIAGDMGEADHVASSMRYSVLFAMGLCLLLFSFGCNLISERIVNRKRKRLLGG